MLGYQNQDGEVNKKLEHVIYELKVHRFFEFLN